MFGPITRGGLHAQIGGLMVCKETIRLWAPDFCSVRVDAGAARVDYHA